MRENINTKRKNEIKVRMNKQKIAIWFQKIRMAIFLLFVGKYDKLINMMQK